VDLARSALYVLHMAGVTALLVGFGLQLAAGRRAMATMMLHGALTQLVTGLALVAVNEADDRELNHTKIAVKLGVTVVVLALVYLNRERDRVPDGVFFGAFALVLTNIALAFGWN
jgi:hypothetical protein